MRYCLNEIRANWFKRTVQTITCMPYFLTSKQWFRPILILSEIWKNIGYGSIVYLAAITSIDQEQYEAARVDGANKLQDGCAH